MRWLDDFLLEGEGSATAERGQYQLAMYAIHLHTGNTIYCKQIKGATVKQYVMAAATFLALFSYRDFRKDDPIHTHMGRLLGPVFKDIERYEEIPNRKEPYSPKMHALARTLSAQFPADSLVAALTDGCEQGYCAGYRLSEFAQPSRRSDPLHPQLCNNPVAVFKTRCFVPNDFEAQLSTMARVVGLHIVSHPLGDILFITLTWRYQKNGRHGERKLFARNKNSTGVCLLSAAYRALSRFQRLRLRDPRLDPAHTPLTVYWSPQLQAVRLLNAAHIESFIRRLASVVYHLHPVDDAVALRQWSSRSLRVGAAVTLHASGFSALDIQWMLRWQSTAFMVYLRNVAVLSQRQSEALDRAAALPFL